MSKWLALSFILVATIGAIEAAELAEKNPSFPQYYPASFHAMGILQELDLKSTTIVINASRYLYDVNIKVHSLTTEHSSLAALRTDTEIGYSFYTQGSKKVVSEVWVLPKGTAELR